MRYLVLGNGWIGNKINNSFDDCFISDKRIRKSEDIVSEIGKYDADVVINCVGRTGMPNIDWCETNKEETLFMNLTIPMLIQRACAFTNTKMVHIGTGCVYTGGPFDEECVPNFIESYYSKTKYLAEQALSDFRVLQLRIRMPIDGVPHPRNLLTKLLSYKKIINCLNSVTILEDFIMALKILIGLNQSGIFNVVNKDPVFHEDILNTFNELSPVKHNYEQITEEELKIMTKTGRSNCFLSTDKIESLGIFLRPTKLALRECLSEYVKLGELCKV